ncbi:MAG: type II secretion system GspH family protein [Alistipes sp.]|nr:type II secretion system GspH family protein [Alistipes sp.]
MKRKGFTLIELIVVIAIIGVLAAILAPTLLGNIKKARIQSANVTAKEAWKSINIALEEAEDSGAAALADSDYGFNTSVGTALETVDAGDGQTMQSALSDQSTGLVNQTFLVRIENGAAKCAAAKEGKYFGTYPPVLTKNNYDTKLPTPTLENALDLAEAQIDNP